VGTSRDAAELGIDDFAVHSQAPKDSDLIQGNPAALDDLLHRIASGTPTHLTAAPDGSDKTTPLTADDHKSDVRCFFGLTDSVRLGCTYLLTIGEQAPCGLVTSLCASVSGDSAWLHGARSEAGSGRGRHDAGRLLV
jgi:hypothetical protein